MIKYDKRLEGEYLWEVYDIATGRVVMIAGQPYDGMAEHEADEIVTLLESGSVIADCGPEAPAADLGNAGRHHNE